MKAADEGSKEWCPEKEVRNCTCLVKVSGVGGEDGSEEDVKDIL